MSFLDKLNNSEMQLIVSLPKNEYEFAKAAWENGADAIKVHINAEHFASKTSFKDIKTEMSSLRVILDDSPVPVGIVIGDNTKAIIEDFEEVLKENFDFISVYYNHAPLEILKQDKIVKTVALNSAYKFEELSNFADLGIEALELSVLKHNEYGDYLTVKDLTTYKSIIDESKLPVIVPTQKHIRLSDIDSLKRIGVSAIMIGAIVTGNEIATFGDKVKAFAKSIHM